MFCVTGHNYTFLLQVAGILDLKQPEGMTFVGKNLILCHDIQSCCMEMIILQVQIKGNVETFSQPFIHLPDSGKIVMIRFQNYFDLYKSPCFLKFNNAGKVNSWLSFWFLMLES